MSFPRYPKYKPSGVEWLGDVPQGWEVPALSYRYRVELGKMLDANQIAGTHLCPYVRNADVQWGRINIVDLNMMDFEPEERARFVLRRGDLLVCEGGEVGRCAVWDAPIAECYYQKALHRLRPIDAARDEVLFLRWLLEAATTSGCFAASEAKATIAHLPAEVFRRHRFAFPPLPEQLAIAAFLDRETAKIDELVEAQARLIELLKEKRQAVISHAVTKGLNPHAPMKPSGVEWLGDVPEGWEVVRMKHAVRLVTEKAEGRTNPIALENIEGWTGALISTQSEFEGEGVAFNAGDILFGKLRPYLAKVLLVTHSGEAVGDFHVLRPAPTIEGRYLQLAMLTRSFISVVDGSTFGSKMPRASWDFVGGLGICTPPLPEQLAIAAFLDRETNRIDTLTAEANRAINLLRERRTALISAAVTGQIDVRNTVTLEVA